MSASGSSSAIPFGEFCCSWSGNEDRLNAWSISETRDDVLDIMLSDVMDESDRCLLSAALLCHDDGPGSS